MNLITLEDVLFYLNHCRIHANPIEKIDECLMIIAETLNSIKNHSPYSSLSDIDKDKKCHFNRFEKLSMDNESIHVSLQDMKCISEDQMKVSLENTEKEILKKLKTKVEPKSKKK